MSQRKLTPSEIQFLQEALGADFITGSIRLREGEYQHSLARAIASFQLESFFPDVKDLTRRLYGEDKTNDIQFIRKIQTILKKMEKSNIVKILPKKKPWDLQRYALSSFKFQDVDKNLVTLATDQEVKQAKDLLHSILTQEGTLEAKPNNIKVEAGILAIVVIVSYAAVFWDLVQPAVSAFIFVPAFAVAVGCSLVLGRILARL